MLPGGRREEHEDMVSERAAMEGQTRRGRWRRKVHKEDGCLGKGAKEAVKEREQ